MRILTDYKRMILTPKQYRVIQRMWNKRNLKKEKRVEKRSLVSKNIWRLKGPIWL